jgi:hypothetical protein
MAQLNSVIFKDKAAAGLGKKLTSLFPGIGYAAGYKVPLPPLGRWIYSRCPNGYINTEDNCGYGISLLGTMPVTLTLSSEKELAKLSFTPLPEGLSSPLLLLPRFVGKY